MVHIALHFLVPLAIALLAYRPRWRSTVLVLVATMAVDVDHLLAVPLYDPERCSIGFHPLHQAPAVVAYGLLTALAAGKGGAGPRSEGGWRLGFLVGLGLLVHMALDGVDCFV